MKNTVVLAIVAIGGGTLGGAIFGRFSRPAPPPESSRAERTEALPPVVIVPPRWDSKLAERVSAIERHLDVADQKGEHLPDAAAQAQPVLDRDAERLAQYQKELEYRARSLADHDSEPLDGAWAGSEAEQIKRDFTLKTPNAGARSVELKAVDCRSKTCMAQLSFPTPLDGLGFVQRGPSTLSVSGCNGYSCVPPPPTGEGRYEVTVLYTCR